MDLFVKEVHTIIEVNGKTHYGASLNTHNAKFQVKCDVLEKLEYKVLHLNLREFLSKTN